MPAQPCIKEEQTKYWEIYKERFHIMWAQGTDLSNWGGYIESSDRKNIKRWAFE